MKSLKHHKSELLYVIQRNKYDKKIFSDRNFAIWFFGSIVSLSFDESSQELSWVEKQAVLYVAGPSKDHYPPEG